MRPFFKKVKILLYVAYIAVAGLAFAPSVFATPFGEGVFGAHTPFGSATSLSVALSGNVSLNLTSNGSNYTATGSHTVTVTSTDAVGYALYVYSPGTNAMTGAGSTIPASANATGAALAVNTWGYNTNGSANFVGMKTTPTLIKQASGPYETGDTTTITYSVLTDFTKPAGTYTVGVVYTAACLYE